MADNVAITAGAGTTIATDEAGSAHYQRIKMHDGTDGSVAPINVVTGLVNKVATYTSAQTGVALWTPGSGKKVVITTYQIQSYGTTAGTAIVWFGASADTTYTRGTDYAIFDGEFAPSTTNKPGLVLAATFCSPTADHILRLTTTNAQSITVSVWGYEV